MGTTLSKTYEFTDNFTIIKHSHTMRFGFDTRRVLYNALMYFYASDDYGQFNFTGSLTGYSLGDFLLGRRNRTSRTSGAHKSTPMPGTGVFTAKTNGR